MKVVFRCPPELRGLIPEPVLARRGLPDWLKAMATTTMSDELGFEIDTVKQCPPFIDAMSAGFLFPLACDIHAHDGRITWDWEPPASTVGAYTRAPVAFHVSDQLKGTPFHEPDSFAVKFINFWTVELPPGWGLLCTHPANRGELPFRSVTGLVHADTYDNFIHFPALWTDPAFEGVLPRGTPVAQGFPVPLEKLELVTGVLEGETAESFKRTKSAVREDHGAYRRHHRKR